MKLSRDQAFLDDRVHHRVQQRDVGVGLELQVMRRVARELGAARIGEDQLRPVLDRVLDPRRGDRMIDDGIGADQEHDVRLHHVHHRIGHRARADAFEQRRDARRVAQARAVVDVVGAEAGAHELLEQVRLLVRCPWPSRSPRARFGPCVSRICAQRAAGERQRLVPASPRGTPAADSAGSIVKSADFGMPGLPDQRLRQPLRMRDVVEAEAALDAQPLVVRRAVAALDVHDLVVVDVVGELAAHAAVRAHRRDLLVDRREVRVVRRRERAGRARLHAFAAGDTGRLAHRIVAGRTRSSNARRGTRSRSRR